MHLEVDPHPFGIEPYLPLIGVIIGGLIVGAFAVYNRRRGNLESKAPSVADSWNETDRARAAKRMFEEWAYALVDLIRGWVRAGRIELTQAENRKLRPPTEQKEE